jgi:hypothetical protein
MTKVLVLAILSGVPLLDRPPAAGPDRLAPTRPGPGGPAAGRIGLVSPGAGGR